MPIQKSASICKKGGSQTRPKKTLTKNEALLLLRQREVLAYHSICEVFRAQGHLTPEKLKLLKEIASALYIPDVRHRAECQLVIHNKELNDIADCVAGPGSDTEWRKESVDLEPVVVRQGQIDSHSLKLADAVAAAIQPRLQQLIDDDDDTVVTQIIKLDSCLFESDCVEPEKEKNSEVSKLITKDESMEVTEDDVKIKDEDKDGDLSSSVSSSSSSDDSQQKEEENKPEVPETTIKKEDTDATLMPPPPPVPFIPSPTQPPPTALPIASPLSPTPPVITVPPPSDMTVVSSAPTPITVPDTSMQVPQIIEAPITDTLLLTEAEEAQARADFFSSLPPLVVVPPPEPSETSAIHPSSPHSPSLVLSPGMSIQIRDDTRKRKHSLSLSPQDTAVVTSVSPVKTVALSSYSKMTPVIVSTAPSGSNQTQVKVAPIISRAKMTTTPQAQKVIIVSNSPTSTTPILQRSLNVPMGSLGLPIIRTNQPRFQTVTAQGASGSTVRPKMVTVPARCRAKGNPMVNLQLKNAVTLKQDVTVVDTSAKRLPGPTKILPKPPGSMFIVNTGHAPHKLSTTVGGGRFGTSEGTKQNVVILQKGTNQRTFTLSNPNKDLMQKLMSKKCVVIQSSKVVPKTISSKLPTPPPSQHPPVTTTAGNVVVLDLSQEQYRQNLGGTTLAEILQASGIISSTSQSMSAQNPTLSEVAQVSSGEGEWLPVETSKSLSLEEVSLPLGQTESFVTLDEAVEMLEDQHTESSVSMTEAGGFTSAASEQVFTITPNQLNSGNLAVVANKTEPIVFEALPSEVAADLDCMSQSFLSHKDGAVTIQHSNIDVPANMSLEDYSSQQMENQNFN